MPFLKRNLGLIVSVVVLLAAFAAAGVLMLNPSVRRSILGDPRAERVEVPGRGSVTRVTLTPGAMIEFNDEGGGTVFAGGECIFPLYADGTGLYDVEVEGHHAIGTFTPQQSGGWGRRGGETPPRGYAIIDGEAGAVTRFTDASGAERAWKAATGKGWPARLPRE